MLPTGPGPKVVPLLFPTCHKVVIMLSLSCPEVVLKLSQSCFQVVVMQTDFRKSKFQKFPPVCGTPILKEGIAKKLADKSMVFGLVFTNQHTNDNHVIPKARAVLEQLYSTKSKPVFICMALRNTWNRSSFNTKPN